MFKFDIGDLVKEIGQGKTYRVFGRYKYKSNVNMYLIDYISSEGYLVNTWANEKDLEIVEETK